MRSLITFAACTAILTPILTTSCQKKGEVTHTKVEKTAPPAPMSAPSPHHGNKAKPATATKQPAANAKKATYSWTLPDGWSDKPAGGMRLGTIIIPNGDSSLSAGIFEFGGDLAGNVNRWRQQVGLPSIPESEILPTIEAFDSPLGKDGKGYIVSLVNPASPGNAMLAAIIPRPAGTSVFLKVTGKSEDLKAIAAPFLTFTQSLK